MVEGQGMASYLENLARAVEAMHGCKCVHLSSGLVREEMGGELVWQGRVETFALQGHPTAKRAFAWRCNDADGEMRYIVVLNVPPIASPREAVQAAIASGKKAVRAASDLDTTVLLPEPRCAS
jgi:hypothetical protein